MQLGGFVEEEEEATGERGGMVFVVQKNYNFVFHGRGTSRSRKERWNKKVTKFSSAE